MTSVSCFSFHLPSHGLFCVLIISLSGSTAGAVSITPMLHQVQDPKLIYYTFQHFINRPNTQVCSSDLQLVTIDLRLTGLGRNRVLLKPIAMLIDRG